MADRYVSVPMTPS